MRRFRLAPLGLGIVIGVLIAAAGLSAVAVLAYGGLKIFSVGTAGATPGQGITGTVLARGSMGEDFAFGRPSVVVVTRKVRIMTKSGIVTKTVKFKVSSVARAITCKPTDPCDTAFQQATIDPGGSSGWHTHPGVTFVAVAQGEGTLYHVTGSSCPSEKIVADTGFVQMPSTLHLVRNEGSVPFVIYTLYVLPHGTSNTALRVDQPQPTACPSIN